LDGSLQEKRNADDFILHKTSNINENIGVTMKQLVTKSIRHAGVLCMILLLTTSIYGQNEDVNQIVHVFYPVVEYGSQIPELEEEMDYEILNKTIGEALLFISTKANLEIVYDSKMLPKLNEKVTLIEEKMSVADALISVLNNTNYEAVMTRKGEILIQKASDDELLLQETVSGRVTDAQSGDPLPGVTVLIMGTDTGTATDIDGFFELTVPTLEETLVFSYVGYVRQEVQIDGREDFDIVLEQEIAGMDELVVVGYGTQERINLTGSVGTTSAERLEGRSIANVGEGLQGVIPNLNVHVPSGDPAQGPSFNIRGFESITGGSPLILVDGIPMDINRINPNDIESVSVLKDAAASAVYGARAAFGVILVETKSGQRGDRFSVTLNSQISAAKPIFNMDPVTDPHEFVLARNIATERTRGTPQFDDSWVEGTRRYSENPTHENAWDVVDGELRFYGFNNYQNEIMTDYAPTMQHDLSLSGGSENSSYYASFGYMSKDGYLATNNENFKRYNVHLEGDFQILDWLALDPKIRFNVEDSDKPHFYNWDVNINSLARVSPIMPIQFPDLDHYLEPGDRDQYEQFIGMYFGGTNFWPYLLDGGRTTFTNNDLWLTQGITLTPLENLRIRSDFSYNNFSRNFKNVKSQVEIVSTDLMASNPISHGFSGDDWINDQNQDNEYFVFNIYGEYHVDRFSDHDIRAMVGFNQEWGTNRFFGAQARSLITPNITDINATVGSQHTSGSSSHVALRGAFYRLNYILKDRYLLEFNGRYDGTSRFAEEDRFGFFPSFSAGWRISNERFMSGVDAIDHLQIRASYGTLGNQMLDDFYPYITTMGIGQSNYIMSDGQIPFVSPAGLVSPTLTWETVVSQNLGLDFEMFGGMISGSFDVYTRDTKDMLMGVDYPDILGTSAPSENAADLRTKGWELELNWRHTVNNDLHYNIGIALADNVSEITKYENPNNSLGDYYVGQRIGEIWGFETVGMFQSEEEIANAADQSQLGSNWMPGDVRYADLNGDGQITFGNNTLDNPGDRRIIGNSEPRYSFGINTGIAYRNFRVTTFFQGVMRRDHFPTTGNWTWFFPFNAGHVENYFLTDTWSEDNRDAYFPAPHIATDTKKNIQTQTRFLQNAAYVRLKNLTVSYDLPERLTSRIGLGHSQIYFTGMNLWEYSPIRAPLDPESIFSGAIVYPMQRIFTLGTRISL